MSDAWNQMRANGHDGNMERAADLMGRAVGTIAALRAAAAVLADSLRGSEARQAIASVAGDNASDRIARYVRTHDAAAVARDLERTVRRYPVQSLAVAVVIGFLLERAVLRRVSET